MKKYILSDGYNNQMYVLCQLNPTRIIEDEFKHDKLWPPKKCYAN